MAKPTKAIERLQKAIDKIAQLKNLHNGTSAHEFKKWRRNTEIALENTFGENSRHVKDFKAINYTPMAYFIDSPDSIWHQPYLDGLDSAVSVLQSMIEEVEEYWEDEEETQPERKKNQKKTIASNSKKIFIIHGHDDGTKETVARFIEQIGLEPVILHEKPNQGRTVIEKFEDYADVGFAIALLTPDDVGNEKNKKDELNPRARQNVIFEFGFFLGQLGRKRVCGIKKNDVEIPSDYKGVLYINLDSEGAWRMQLVQELKAADIDVDANLAF